MEKELIMNEEVETETTELDIYDESEEVGGAGKVVAAVVGTAVVGGGVALYFKCKDKIKAKRDEHQVKRLEKRGFVVCKPEEVEAEEIDCSTEVEKTTEE